MLLKLTDEFITCKVTSSKPGSQNSELLGQTLCWPQNHENKTTSNDSRQPLPLRFTEFLLLAMVTGSDMLKISDTSQTWPFHRLVCFLTESKVPLKPKPPSFKSKGKKAAEHLNAKTFLTLHFTVWVDVLIVWDLISTVSCQFGLVDIVLVLLSPESLSLIVTCRRLACVTSKWPRVTCLRAEACFLDQDEGGCQNYAMMWFFDTEQNECARFWYGGCGGNSNRFETQEECENLCLSKSRWGTTQNPWWVKNLPERIQGTFRTRPTFRDSFTLSLQLLRSCERFLGSQLQVFHNVRALCLYWSKIVIITSII